MALSFSTIVVCAWCSLVTIPKKVCFAVNVDDFSKEHM